jgi:Outer membrane protein beta-barrel domain
MKKFFINFIKSNLGKEIEMKKQAFIVPIVFLLGTLGSALTQPQIGIIGGLNVADVKISVEDLSESSPIKTFGLGGLLEIGLVNNVHLSLQPMYIQKGGIIEGSEFQPEREWNMELLEIPVLFKMDFGDRIRPYFLAGPEIGVILNSEITAEIDGITFKGDLSPVTRQFDFGLGFGAGISFQISQASLFLESRYALGLNDLTNGGTFEASAGPITLNGTIKPEDEASSRGIQFFAGLTIPLGW